MDEKKVPEGILFLHEELLNAQLRVIRRLRAPAEEGAKRKEGKGRSNMSIVIDLLRSSKKPLHVSEIIKQARERYGRALDRESLVSALVKKVKAGSVARPAPNTFKMS